MASTSPKQIVDKNGKHTTVHAKDDDSTAAASKRIVSIKAQPAPASYAGSWRGKGLHWANVDNRRFESLALEQALYYNSDWSIDEAYDESDGSIEVNFGSTGATLKLRHIDSEAQTLFGYGHCALLALSMHDKTDLPFVVFTAESKDSDDGWSGHAALLVGDGKILDIGGVHDIGDVEKKYSALDGSYAVMDRAEFVKLIVDEEYKENPYEFLGELEQFVLDDFAEFIVGQELDVK
jgi:hypothetical protein